MEDMYVWEVKLQVEWEVNWKEGNKKKSDTWDDEETFTVASSSGFGAIEKAKKLAMDTEKVFDNVSDKGDEEPIKTYRPKEVLDVVYLELKETLDG